MRPSSLFLPLPPLDPWVPAARNQASAVRIKGWLYYQLHWCLWEGWGSNGLFNVVFTATCFSSIKELTHFSGPAIF